MSEAKHTPGPWRMTDGGDKRHKAISIMADHGGIDGDGGQVASIGVGFGIHFTREQATANARLIAAAPELLAACEQLLAVMATWQTDPEIAPKSATAVSDARTAIAKAKGQS